MHLVIIIIIIITKCFPGGGRCSHSSFSTCSLFRFPPHSVAGQRHERSVPDGHGHQPQHPLRDSEGAIERPLGPSSQWAGLQHGLQPTTSAGLKSLQKTVELQSLKYSALFLFFFVTIDFPGGKFLPHKIMYVVFLSWYSFNVWLQPAGGLSKGEIGTRCIHRPSISQTSNNTPAAFYFTSKVPVVELKDILNCYVS